MFFLQFQDNMSNLSQTWKISSLTLIVPKGKENVTKLEGALKRILPYQFTLRHNYFSNRRP